MKRKYVLIFAAIGVIVVAASLLVRAMQASPNTPMHSVVTGGPTLTPVSPPTVSSAPPVAEPPLPTFAPDWSTVSPLTPPPVVPVGCVQDGVSTAGWDTEPNESGSINPQALGPIAPPSASTGPCFDKLVFTVQTISDVEFTARYVPVVTGDGSGLPVTDIKGSKFIQLTIVGHMLRDDDGNPQYDPAAYNMPDVQGFGNLRELRLVTADYEGRTTFGIGVDTMTSFEVETYSVGDENNRFTNVVVYIARPHR